MEPFLLSTLNHIQVFKSKSLVTIDLNKTEEKNHDKPLEYVHEHRKQSKDESQVYLCSYILLLSLLLHCLFELTRT